MCANQNKPDPVKEENTGKKKWKKPSLIIINKENPLREILDEIFLEEVRKKLREK